MPSRNKRNKNRPNANAKNTTNVKPAETAASNVIVSKETESSQNLKEAEEKLAELQKNVDSIKESIGQAASAATASIIASANESTIAKEEEEKTEEKAEEKAEAPSTKTNDEQQTLKKKRNRNRNRKKNSSNVNESGGISSSSGTHESSPTISAPIATPPAAPDVIAEKITEEPQQSTVPLEKIEDDDCVKTKSLNATNNEKQEISCDTFVEEIDVMPSKINNDQPIIDDDNSEKTKTNVDDVGTVDEKKIDDDNHVVDEATLKSDTIFVKDEKPHEIRTEMDNPIKELDIAIATDKELAVEKQSEKLEDESKKEDDRSEVKNVVPEVEKPSPKIKNKNNNHNKNAKEAKKANNENKKTEKKPPERIKTAESKPIEKIPLATSEVDENIIESETKNTELAKIADNNVTATSMTENATETPTSIPITATPAPEISKKPIQHEDETAKIWKILEEASKSLEPVEIQMDDEPMTNINNLPLIETNVPILHSPVDQQQVEEKAKDLAALLQTTETDKVKTSTSPKPTNEVARSGAKPKSKPKQTNPTVSIDSQSKKHAEPTEASVKSIQKDPTLSKPNEQQVQVDIKQEDETVEESTEEKRELVREISPENLVQQMPSTEKTSETVLPADDEIPLDVSILPDHIDVPEMNTDSKNVQGSGFVPSVDKTAAETESLVHETIENLDDKIESNVNNIPVHSNKENASKSMIAQTTDNSTSPSSNASNKSTNKNDIKVKTEVTDQSMTQEKKRSQRTDKPNQTNCTAKNTSEKVSSNSKKSNEKPVIPPKPNHLVSSQVKKSQAVTTKSAKIEKILSLTGTNADDEDSEDDYIEYKFMPRPVFIATICQLCKKPTEMNERILCQLCNMVSYCKIEHAEKDEPQHRDLCAAFQEIAKKRGGHIYNNARILNDNDYRSLRVHTLNLCENFLKRPLQTYEREILLFPRLCLHTSCREWRPNLLADCSGCGQAFYCSAQSDHLVETHQRWCKSVALYRNLVVRQSVSGRIEPSLPSRIQNKPYKLPNTIGDVFKDLYKNYAAIKDECVFATLTQLATIPLTAYFTAQKADLQIGEKFTIHLIGAELQFEADVLDIWETFFLHLAHNLVELTIVFCGPELNAENIPLDIISRIRMCRTCRQHCRIVKFDFQCAKLYHDYAKSAAYSKPDLICFFNPGFHHVNSLNTFDTWSETIKIASMSDCPVVVTSYTEYESPRDLARFQHETTNHANKMDLIHGPSHNLYASQRPERNFISDQIVPVIFKNYFCFVLK